MYTNVVGLAGSWVNAIEKVERDRLRKRKRKMRYKKKIQNPDNESQINHGRF